MVEQDANRRKVVSCRIVPERGTWVEFSLNATGVMQARLGQSGKMPATWVLRAFFPEAGDDAGLLEMFYGREMRALKLETAGQLVGQRLAGAVMDGESGRERYAAGHELTLEDVHFLLQGGLSEIETLKQVDDLTILNTIAKDSTRTHEQAVMKIYARFRPEEPASYERAVAFLRDRFQDPRRYSLGSVGRFRLNRKLGLDAPGDAMTLRKEDILEAVKYLIAMRHGKGTPDDIDHLGNRLLRPVARLAEDHLRESFLRLRRDIESSLEKVKGGRTPPPRTLCDGRAIQDGVRAFFGRSELSQVVDQINPLAQLAHERRVSALGPGGLSRKRAGFEARDVHPSHYGRLCPIETPEGPNIGLISYLSLYARLDPYGFVTSPFRPVKGGKPSDEIVWLRADEEEGKRIAPAGALSDGAERVVYREAGEFVEGPVADVDYVEVSPRQMVGVSGALIPFLEHDDANRALMGSNMQRQAVPLLAPEKASVITGVESAVAASS
ncbi:MAG TPA: DNA-directed RNA polymerase subunit beta, partial [Anaerolineae bacterium]|nr:DNA-directed RNA polymerase subunit beta [Anaerolineae bacterium]